MARWLGAAPTRRLMRSLDAATNEADARCNVNRRCCGNMMGDLRLCRRPVLGDFVDRACSHPQILNAQGDTLCGASSARLRGGVFNQLPATIGGGPTLLPSAPPLLSCSLSSAPPGAWPSEFKSALMSLRRRMTRLQLHLHVVQAALVPSSCRIVDVSLIRCRVAAAATR